MRRLDGWTTGIGVVVNNGSVSVSVSVVVLTTRLCRRFGYVPLSLSLFWIVAVLVSPF